MLVGCNYLALRVNLIFEALPKLLILVALQANLQLGNFLLFEISLYFRISSKAFCGFCLVLECIDLGFDIVNLLSQPFGIKNRFYGFKSCDSTFCLARAIKVSNDAFEP